MIRSTTTDAAEVAEWIAHVEDILEHAPAPFRNAPPISVVVEPEQGYDEWATAYDEEDGEDFRGSGIEVLEADAVRRTLEHMSAGRILDAGCGTGRHSAYLSALGHAVVGVDASDAMVRQARERVPSGEFSVGSVEQLAFPSASFSAALCALTLGHLEDPVPAIRELARVLQPNAPLVISHLHPFATELLKIQPTFIRQDGSAAYVREHTHYHGHLLEAFADAGLRVRSCVEPRLTGQIAAELAPPKHASSYERALTGLPGFVVWELQRDARAVGEAT